MTGSPVTLFTAKKIITMDEDHPLATAVAVKDGRILAAGKKDELIFHLNRSAFCSYTVDDRFSDKVLMPGLVDAHTHVELQGFIYAGHFVSQIPWPDPAGGFSPVCPDKTAVIKRLKTLADSLAEGAPIFAVAYDENTAGDLTLADLDGVSESRPVLVANSVFHRFWCNRFLLDQSGIKPGNCPEGVETDGGGIPTGVLTEFNGLMAVIPGLPSLLEDLAGKVRHILPLFTRGGNTTLCEAALGTLGLDFSLGLLSPVFNDSEEGLRLVGLPWAQTLMKQGASVDEFICQMAAARQKETDRLRIGAAKLYTDGSLISKTAPAGWPGYWDGSADGTMACDPDTVRQWIIALHRAGIPTVTHTNTDKGCRLVLDAVQEAQAQCCRPDIRHRIDHCYTVSEASLRRARALGVGVQFFSPQLYYYGESHLKLLGPGRAERLTPVGTARRLGVSWGCHNDPPGTPQLPWTAIHTLVNRETFQGTCLGPSHRVTVAEALRAVTLEAAFQMHLDHEIGSIVPGKKADFCVLEADPLTQPRERLKDMPVWGTVFGGIPRPAVR